MKFKVERVTAKGIEKGLNGELPYRVYTHCEEDIEYATQEDIDQLILDEVHARLEAITIVSACQLEITIRVTEEEH